MIPSNWPLQNLCKEGDEQRKSEKVKLSLTLSPVHIDNISHRLERIKRDTKRQ